MRVIRLPATAAAIVMYLLIGVIKVAVPLAKLTATVLITAAATPDITEARAITHAPIVPVATAARIAPPSVPGPRGGRDARATPVHGAIVPTSALALLIGITLTAREGRAQVMAAPKASAAPSAKKTTNAIILMAVPAHAPDAYTTTTHVQAAASAHLIIITTRTTAHLIAQAAARRGVLEAKVVTAAAMIAVNTL